MRPSTSIRTRSKPTSMSMVSPGTCWKYQAISPVRGRSANVALVYSAASSVVIPRLAATQGFGSGYPNLSDLNSNMYSQFPGSAFDVAPPSNANANAHMAASAPPSSSLGLLVPRLTSD